jgi:type II secretory pathway pseudopilin PulG
MLRNNRGDTIVEVMFSLAIVAFVLGLAYASAANSVKIGRDAQERAESTKLAESQIELIKARLDAGNRDVLTTSDFCMRNDATMAPLPSPDCTRGIYSIVIDPSSSGTTYEYVVNVTWDSITGNLAQTVLKYRLVDH